MGLQWDKPYTNWCRISSIHSMFESFKTLWIFWPSQNFRHFSRLQMAPAMAPGAPAMAPGLPEPDLTCYTLLGKDAVSWTFPLELLDLAQRRGRGGDRGYWWIPGLVNSNIWQWKITIFSMGKSTINGNFPMENHHFQWEKPLYMAIFHCYVSSPEGRTCDRTAMKSWEHLRHINFLRAGNNEHCYLLIVRVPMVTMVPADFFGRVKRICFV